MTEYIYLPVPSEAMIKMALDIQATRKSKAAIEPAILRNQHDSGIGKGLTRWINGGCLRMVGGNDTLYLVLHGAGQADSRNIGEKRNGVWKTFTPETIARTLNAEGLTKSFVDLKMLTCGSGLEGAMTSFAERTYDELCKLGYNRIMVTGYLGDVRAGAGSQGSEGFAVEEKGKYGGARLVKASYAEQIVGTRPRS